MPTATTKTKPAPVELAPQTLTALDRCDACGARAWAKAEFLTHQHGGTDILTCELKFCGHHFAQHREAIKAQALSVVDETGYLTEAAHR